MKKIKQVIDQFSDLFNNLTTYSKEEKYFILDSLDEMQEHFSLNHNAELDFSDLKFMLMQSILGIELGDLISFADEPNKEIKQIFLYSIKRGIHRTLMCEGYPVLKSKKVSTKLTWFMLDESNIVKIERLKKIPFAINKNQKFSESDLLFLRQNKTPKLIIES